MEPTVLIIAVALAVVAGIAMGLALRNRSVPVLSPAQRNLPVVDNDQTACADCRFFSLEGGQVLMQSHPAFAAAAQHLPPWMMGQPRKVEPNPEYDALEAEMNQAGDLGDYDRQRELHERLLQMRPGTLLPPEDYVEEPLLKLQWADFGACGKHSELRAKTDRCDDWEVKP